MAVKTSDQSLANWIAGMQSGQTATKYRAGIDRYQGNPMEQAATDASLQLYLTKVQNSVTSGRRRNKLMATPVSRWRDNAKNVGATLLSSGATKAKDKVGAHFQKFTAVYQQASDAAKALPKGGLENAMARVRAAVSVMMQAAGTA